MKEEMNPTVTVGGVQLGSFVIQHEVNYPKLTQMGLILIAAFLGSKLIIVVFAALLASKP